MNVDDIKIGWWYTYCCPEDLYPIETAEELADVVDDLREQAVAEDYDGVPVRVWPTLEAALADPVMQADLAGHVSERTRKRLGLQA